MLNKKNNAFYLILAGIATCSLMSGCALVESSAQSTRTRDFGFDWKFVKGDVQNAHKADTDDSKWELVQVPHDWSIEGPKDKDNPAGTQGGFWPNGIGW